MNMFALQMAAIETFISAPADDGPGSLAGATAADASGDAEHISAPFSR
ncbi:hypothetical protein [Planomonospora algeriensis]